MSDILNLSVSPLVASFHSYRGGTGKTTLITQIALYTSQIQKRKTILIDMDMHSPGLNTTLGISNKESYINRLLEKKSEPRFILESIINFRENFNVLLADRSKDALTLLYKKERHEWAKFYKDFVKLSKLLQEEYDVVLLDTGSNDSHPTIVAYLAANCPTIVAQMYRDDRIGTTQRIEMWKTITSVFSGLLKKRETIIINRVPSTEHCTVQEDLKSSIKELKNKWKTEVGVDIDYVVPCFGEISIFTIKDKMGDFIL